MVQIRLSFILPCYNVEKYITYCLDSLLKQDIPHQEYEILCVNDCSTDTTQSIIEQYCEKYKNIKLINHKENKTAGGARNSGLELAKGQYIWFVDPDDFIKKNVLREIIDVLIQNNLDILLFNFESINEFDNTNVVQNQYFTNSAIHSGLQFIETNFYKQISRLSIVWHQIYKREFLNRNKLFFPEIRVGQDGIFSWKSLIKAQRVMSIDNHYYTYRQNNDSITKKKIRADVLFARHVLFSLEANSLLNQNKGIPEFIKEDIAESAKWAINSLIKEKSKLDWNEHRKLCLMINGRKRQLLYLTYLSRKTKWMIQYSKILSVLPIK